MDIKNKKIVFLGDSITEGALLEDHSKKFASLIEKKTGAICVTDSICGTRIARQFSEGKREKYSDFCDRANRTEAPADIVAVFGGTNDYGHGDAPIGDLESRDVYTFYGALHTLIITLKKRYENAKIVFITPLHRMFEDNPCGECKKEPIGTLSEYVGVIKEVAGYYELDILDLFGENEISPKTATAEDENFFDGLHPNENGHRLLSDRIIKYFENL